MEFFSQLDSSWKKALSAFFSADHAQKIENKVSQAFSQTTCYPKKEDIFRAFSLTSFEKTRVVILGQDPYHGLEQAHGLAFSVPDHIAPPPSLKNIFKELNHSTGKLIPPSGNLTHWAQQGVLLLNATLTVEKSKPGSHQKFGWESFTDEVIYTLSDKKDFVVFLLWGNFAQKKIRFIDSKKHVVLKASHPSPLSANRGNWFGNNHFVQTNELLTSRGHPAIDW